jgi:hypothetical protein
MVGQQDDGGEGEGNDEKDGGAPQWVAEEVTNG